jgi:hypothetical protein
MSATAYPLAWPFGWKRTPAHSRQRATFGATKLNSYGWNSKERLTLAEASGRLVRELELLGAINQVLSTNLELRLDGWPRSGQRAPDDPGAAVYFEYAGKATALACDKWDRVEDNIAAIAKHIEALRGMDRWGVGSLEQAFTGYQALPAPDPWWKLLGLDGPTRDAKAIGAAYRKASAQAHPDRPGGSHDRMAAVNAARDEGMKSLAVAE